MATQKSMGPAQLLAWLGTIVLAFLALVVGLLAVYRTELIQQRLAAIEDERTSRQTELMTEIRDLLRQQRGLPANAPAQADTPLEAEAP
jgi:hypothetical protein